MTGLIFVCC